jgi:hypothetical protein
MSEIDGNKLLDKLKFYSKDGIPPKNKLTLGKNYVITNIIVVIVSIAVMIYAVVNKTFKKRWNWRTFFIVTPVCIISGFVSGIMLIHYDPKFPGWLMLPWNTLGNIGPISIDDFIFFIFVTFLFYFFYRFFQNKKVTDFKNHNAIKAIFYFFMVVLSILALSFGAMCSKSLTLFYTLPALFLMAILWKKINIKQFLIFFIIMVIFEVFWDVTAVSLVYYIKSYAPGWIYITFVDGKPLHSSVFLSYEKYPWAWILYNPIEMTPYYGMAGAFFVYVFILGVDQLTVNKNEQ